MAITEFLTARLGEAEKAALAEKQSAERQGRALSDWAKYVIDPVIGPYGGQTQLRNVATGLYVARVSDPNHVLADIAAKRRILELHTGDHECPSEDWNCGFWMPGATYEDADGTMVTNPPCPTVRLLASPFSGHPDFNPDWSA